MGRPVRLTDEERKRSNAERQRRWKARHFGFAKLKERNAWAKRKAIREKATPNEKVFTPNAHSNVLPHFGDELRYEDEPGVDVGYGEMEPKYKGGRQQSPARATSGGPVVRGDGPGLDGAYPGVYPGLELIAGPAAGPKPLGDAPGASLRALTPNEKRTYARLEEFKARRAAKEKGVQVELIL